MGGIRLNLFLAIDFGSTYTKLTAIDIENEVIAGTSKSMTTIGDNIINGYNKALDILKETLAKDYGNEIEFTKISASSSAAGGLKMIAIGLVPTLTAEAAKMAALSSGGYP